MVGVIYLLDMSVLLYNPNRKNKREFIAEFVIRTRIFDEILADITTGRTTTPEQHYLLLGQRGAGVKRGEVTDRMRGLAVMAAARGRFGYLGGGSPDAPRAFA